MRALEAELEAPLLDRGGEQMRLTPLGESVRRLARDMQRRVEPGDFQVWIGGSSATELRAEFRIAANN